MRIFKILIGGLILVVGIYVLVGERLVGTSTDATLNARVIALRTPIDGEATIAVRSVGTRVGANSLVAEIVDRRFDNSRLLELERDQGLRQTELQRTRQHIEALAAVRGRLQTQSDSYQSGRIRQIEARVGEASATLDSANAKMLEAESAFKRTLDLTSRGLQTAITADRAQANYSVAQLEVRSVRERLDYLQTELTAAREGVFLGDSYNDTPFSLQRIREIDLRVAELQIEQAQLAARIVLGDRQIAAERVRQNNLTSATVTAPTTGVVWDVLSETGEFVRRGQDLVRLVDCASVLVTASVSENVYNSLRMGDEAQLRLFGDSRVLSAVITRLGGASAGALYASLAIAPRAEHLRRFDVTLTVTGLADHPDLECAIGRTGRLVYTSGPLAKLAQLLTRFGL